MRTRSQDQRGVAEGSAVLSPDAEASSKRTRSKQSGGAGSSRKRKSAAIEPEVQDNHEVEASPSPSKKPASKNSSRTKKTASKATKKGRKDTEAETAEDDTIPKPIAKKSGAKTRGQNKSSTVKENAQADSDENASEEAAAKPQKSSKKQKSTKTKKGKADAVAVAEDDEGDNPSIQATSNLREDSDDDAPEEMSLSTAKKEAQIETQRRQQSKGRAKKGHTQPPQQVVPVGDQGNNADSAVPSLQPNLTARGENEEDDYLPDSVIQALQSTQRPMYEDDDELDEPARANSNSQAMNLDLEDQSAPGGRIVRVLEDRPIYKPSASAVEYMKQKMFGSRLRRSKEMLRPLKPIKKQNASQQKSVRQLKKSKREKMTAR